MKARLVCFLLMISVAISAINHMDVMATITGDFDGSLFGYSMASLDFNGDGIKDLAVQEPNWNGEGVYNDSQRYGRIYLYWGGVNFDNIPDFSISGSANLLFDTRYCQIINAGDVNNDSIEDLAVTTNIGVNKAVMIYFGSTNPDNAPDVVFQFSTASPDGYTYIGPAWLGDINADNCDDIGLTMQTWNGIKELKILYGGSFTLFDYMSLSANNQLRFNGIGDVNGDGVDDYHLKLPLHQSDQSQNRLSVHMGSISFPVVNEIVICSNTNQYINDHASAVGDINGDGIDDFVSYIYEDGKVWFGRTNLSTQWDAIITPSFYSTVGEILSHGDFNNDGYEDILAGSPGYGFDDGRAMIWLGGSSFNGTADLIIPLQSGTMEQFGFAKVTGDFNNDGYCDAAISQPFCPYGVLLTEGHVYVFSGNAELQDTTVANDDIFVPVTNSDPWEAHIYPNPVSKDIQELHIEFTGKGYVKINKPLNIDIYNLKGQKVYTSKISRADLAGKHWLGKLKHLPAGRYLIKISDRKTKLTTRLITVN